MLGLSTPPPFQLRETLKNTCKATNNGSYRTGKHPETDPSSGSSQVFPSWVIYHELVLTTKEYRRQVIELKILCPSLLPAEGC
ncbi:hypothetical protein RCOM_0867200 [Ricinus communis]|uniref:Uncharacterized protein n=1 Tax=Ricinus communis TaxID=3988 RepID=B9S1Q0_RICCO|nr:hypothetical protein RCOM_0867200 [Ricinus communis]